MRNEIILVGPMIAGKTTIANLLSKQLGIQSVNVDKLKWIYFKELGYKESEADKAFNRDGIRGLYCYYKKFEFTTLELILSQYKNCIFDLGAGFVVYDEYSLQNKLSVLLGDFYNKYLILPHANRTIAENILKRRFIKRYNKDPQLKLIMSSTPNFDLNNKFLDFFYGHFSSYKVVYTKDKSRKKVMLNIIANSIPLNINDSVK